MLTCADRYIEKILFMKHVKLFEAFLNEEWNPATAPLTSKTPEEVTSIELDMAWDDTDAEEDKAAKDAFKQHNIEVEEVEGVQPGTYEMTGKKKDILAYLQSEFYEMDADDIKEYYPELLD